MIIQSVNQSFNSFTTKVTQPTGDATLYDDNGFQLVWDATAKWFKFIPVNIQDYDTGYLFVDSNMITGGTFDPVDKRSQTKNAAIWLNSDPSVAPTSTLTTSSYSSVRGIIECLQTDLKADCDLFFQIDVNINAPLGTAASATADSFITSSVRVAKWA